MAKHEDDLQLYQDAVARWKALEERPQWDYSWRHPETSRAAVEYIRRELKRNEGSRWETHPGILEDGRATLFDVVVGADGTVLGAFNDTFLCPPWCR
jgi:hypothetical protein